MLDTSRISTLDTPFNQRASLVRDTAFNLFNLEVSLDGTAPASVTADIRIARGQQVSLVDVNTSASVVRRTSARARAATSGHMMVYLIRQGGSWFQNGRGDVFQTTAGSVVVGSQDAAYQAGMPPGQNWRFQALSVPEHLLSRSAHRIRQGGFQAAPPQAPLHPLLSSYLGHFCGEFTQLRSVSLPPPLAALDELLAATLGDSHAQDDGLAHTLSVERCRLALQYIKARLESRTLSAVAIAKHLCISPRQLHRAFEASGSTVTAEIRRLRLERARHLVCSCPQMPIISIAVCCGFQSQATFYRAFKAEFGVTASELRAASSVMPECR